MPFIHSQKDLTHITNNSIPTFVLLSSLIYYYRKIALWVVLTIWLGSGFLLWNIAESTGSYHIGISGVIYGLFSFLFVSGIFRKHTPMWAISLFVIFLYGSLIWGIFPTDKTHFLGRSFVWLNCRCSCGYCNQKQRTKSQEVQVRN